MGTFGRKVDGPAGRRSAKRQSVAMDAAASSLSCTHPVIVVEISTSGAKLQGSELPEQGAEVVVKASEFEAFADVMWRDGDHCGVRFDPPLSSLVVSSLRERSEPALLRGLTPQEQLAMTAWRDGTTR